jgi:hypothetical protein
MNNILFSEDGYPRVYTIHSQKGGVGKTSVALALAGISGAIGKKTLLIDADMTGASIADIQGMECEIGKHECFNKLILAKPNEFRQVTAIWPSPKDKKPTSLENRFCQKMAGYDSIYFIPSSVKAEDIESMVPLISQEDHLHFFRHRIEDIIATAIRAGFEIIILDHSPGLFGFSKTSLKMSLEWSIQQDKSNHRLRCLLNEKSPEPTLQALLVSSFESPDYKSVLASFQYVFEKLTRGDQDIESYKDSFRMIFNKAGEVSDSIEALNEMLHNIDNLDNKLKQMIKAHEKEFGPQLAPFIENFEMGDICLKAKAFVQGDMNGIAGRGKWERWLRTLAYRARLI